MERTLSTYANYLAKSKTDFTIISVVGGHSCSVHELDRVTHNARMLGPLRYVQCRTACDT